MWSQLAAHLDELFWLAVMEAYFAGALIIQELVRRLVRRWDSTSDAR